MIEKRCLSTIIKVLCLPSYVHRYNDRNIISFIGIKVEINNGQDKYSATRYPTGTIVETKTTKSKKTMNLSSLHSEKIVKFKTQDKYTIDIFED
jgi:hypothetical protein